MGLRLWEGGLPPSLGSNALQDTEEKGKGSNFLKVTQEMTK